MLLTQRAFAYYAGTTHRAVQKAFEAGHLVASPAGKLDPNETRNAAWIAQQRTRRGNGTAPVIDMLAAESSRLRLLEYEVRSRSVFYLERTCLRDQIQDAITRLVALLREFVPGQGAAIAAEVGADPARLLPELQSAIDGLIANVSARSLEVESVLNAVAEEWSRFPPRLPAELRPEEAFVPPTDLMACRSRSRQARASLDQLKAEVRTGTRLARKAAELRVGSFIVGIRTMASEEFLARPQVLELVHRLGPQLHHAIRRRLRDLLRALHAELRRREEAAE
jgi:hypothetical protein